jgi:hypothetical protein
MIASNAFQIWLAERTGEFVDPTIRSTVEQRFKAMILRTLGSLQEKVDRPTAQICNQLVATRPLRGDPAPPVRGHPTQRARAQSWGCGSLRA